MLHPSQHKIFSRIAALASVQIPRARAAAIFGTFVAAFAAIGVVKIFKLPAASSEGIFDADYARAAAAGAIRTLLTAELVRLTGATVAVVILAKQLRPRWPAWVTW